MTKEERELRREQREHMKRMEAAAKEAGRGPIDVPFLLLVLLLSLFQQVYIFGFSIYTELMYRFSL